MLTLYSLYVGLLFVTTVIGIALAAYAWRHRHTPGAMAFAWVMLGMALSSFSLAMLAFTNSAEAADFWGRRVRFITNATTPALLLIFAIQYTGRGKWLNWPRLALLLAIPLISLILTWGGEAHYVFLHFSTGKVGPFTFLGRTTTTGPWNAVHLTYSYVAILLSLVLLLLQAFRTKFPYRGQAMLLFAGGLVPFLANVPDSFMAAGPKPSFTPFGFAALGLIYAWALFRYRLFDLVPVARDRIIDSMEDAVLVADIQGRVVDLNPAAGKLLGCSASEAVGQPMTQLLPAWSEVQEQDHGHRLGTEIVMDEGERVRTIVLTRQHIRNQNGDVVGELGILRDITDRKQMEQELQESEEEYRLLIENLQEGVWAIDAGARTTFVNQRMAEMLGYAADEMLGKHLFEFMDERGIEVAQRNLERRQQGVQERHDFEFLRRDGTRVYTTLETAPVTDEQGNYLGALAGVMDISDRRRNEEALERRVEELDALNRIAQMVGTLTDLPHALRAVTEIVTSLFSATGSAIAVWESNQMEVLAFFEQDQGSSDLVGRSLPMARASAIREPLDRGEAISIADIRGVLLPEGLDQPLRTRNVRALLVAPLRVRGTAFGVLTVATTEPGRVFSPDEIRLAETIAADVAAAIENARLYEQAQELAISRERQRLARDLHDSVTQTLYSVALTAEALPRVWGKHPDQAQAALSNLHRLARGALGEMRTLLFELQPAMLLEKGPEELLRQLAHATMGRTQATVEARVQGERALPDDVQVVLYRIAQEALNNVAKHSEAGHVLVELELGPERVVLDIKDDGRGFNPDAVLQLGFGMRNMADRAKEIGAAFSLQSHPGGGTQIHVLWPEPPPEHPDRV